MAAWRGPHDDDWRNQDGQDNWQAQVDNRDWRREADWHREDASDWRAEPGGEWARSRERSGAREPVDDWRDEEDREWRNAIDEREDAFGDAEDEGNDWQCAVLPDHIREIVGPRGRVITQIERESLASLDVTSSRGGRVAAVDKNVVVRGSASAKKKAIFAIMNAVQKSDGICRLKLFVPREVGNRALTEGNYEFEKIKWDADGVWVEGVPEDIAHFCAVAFVMERPSDSDVVALKVAFPHKLIKKLVGTPERRLSEFQNILCQIDACYEQVPNALNPIVLRGLQNEKLSALQVILEKLEACGDGIMQVVMVLPKDCMKAAIGGTLGQNTLKMEQETSCTIEFSREDQDNVVQCSCKITGPAPENVLEACKLLDEIATKEPLALADKEFAKANALPLKRERKDKELPAQKAPARAAEVREETLSITAPKPSVLSDETRGKDISVDVLIASASLSRLSTRKLEDIRDVSSVSTDAGYGKESLVKIRGLERGVKLALAHLFWELGEGGTEMDRCAVLIPMHVRSRVRAAIPRIETQSNTQMQVDPPAPRRPHSRVALRGDPNSMTSAILLLHEYLSEVDEATPSEEKRTSENSVDGTSQHERPKKRRRTDTYDVDGEPIGTSHSSEWDDDDRWKRKGLWEEKSPSREASAKRDARSWERSEDHVKEDELVLLLARDFEETIDIKALNTAKDIHIKASTIQRRRALTLRANNGQKERIQDAVRELCKVLEQLGHLPTLTVWMHPWVLGMIVGRKGCNVMEAQRTSGCRMDVSRALSTLTVSGDYMEQVAFGIEHALALANER